MSNNQNHYDAVIIGAGMSGMAAAIRLSMFDKKVLLLEKHVISGGLNSYYRRAKRDFDVGLHALTNFAGKKEKNKPLKKLLKQLRIPYDELKLCEQKQSLISFPDCSLSFTNDIEFFKNSISEKFPDQIDGFNKLVDHIIQFDEVNLENKYQSAKEVIASYISSPLLREMIICPLLIYGSAWEHDMDFSQFAIMFKAIYLEGFARPDGGVRTIINLLLKRLEEVGADVRFRCGVEKIIEDNGKVKSVITTKGEEFTTDLIISSAGYPETLAMLDQAPSEVKPRTGKMSFVESILITNKKPFSFDQKNTIIFANNSETYNYSMPSSHTDYESAVLCFPNNFENDDYEEGVLRATFMANYSLWNEMPKETYKEQKETAKNKSIEMFAKFMPGFNSDHIVFSDTFSPTTVKKYTNHFGGTVYGSPDKSRDGRTPIDGLVLCGTDQGFLGIIGSALSGISMANLHGLQSGLQGDMP